MKLYMDDMRLAPEGWIVVRTIEETMQRLVYGGVEDLSLDHDMGACKSCTESGAHVGDMKTPETTFIHWCPHAHDGTKLVLWMIEHNKWPTNKPTVHSMNPVGRERMVGLIERYWPDRKRCSACHYFFQERDGAGERQQRCSAQDTETALDGYCHQWTLRLPMK